MRRTLPAPGSEVSDPEGVCEVLGFVAITTSYSFSPASAGDVYTTIELTSVVEARFANP